MISIQVGVSDMPYCEIQFYLIGIRHKRKRKKVPIFINLELLSGFGFIN